MKVVEELIVGKTGNNAECEDGIVITDDFVAVIDGATDKTARLFSGVPGGQFAMLACADAIRSLAPAADVGEALAHISAVLAHRLPSGLSTDERPSAVVSIYSRARRAVWQVGDVNCWYPGIAVNPVVQNKRADRYAIDIRVAVLEAELARGAKVVDLASHDPGRDAIIGILRHQSIFRNNTASGEWAYPAIDGENVPIELIRIHSLPLNITQLVLATDGYPRVFPTLEASERSLKQLLAEDPLCIGSLRGTKGLVPGNISYDDRAYLRLLL